MSTAVTLSFLTGRLLLDAALAAKNVGRSVTWVVEECQGLR